MAAAENHIKRVQEKLQQLLKQYLLLQKENEKLQAAVKKLQGEKENQLHLAEQLELQVGILKTVSGRMNETDKKAFEKNINHYLKDLDKCIALLSE